MDQPLATYHHYLRLFEWLYSWCIHTIIKNRWSDFVTNIAIFERTKINRTEALLLKFQLCCAGHVSMVINLCLPKIHWSSGLPGNKEAIHCKFDKIPWCLIHRASLMFDCSWEPIRQPFHHQPGCPIWKHPQNHLQENRCRKMNHYTMPAISDETFCSRHCDCACLSPIILITHESVTVNLNKPCDHTHTHTHTHTHSCQVGWGFRIHRLLLCRGVRHPNKCPKYDTKQYDGEDRCWSFR